MIFPTAVVFVVIAQLTSAQQTYDDCQDCDARCSAGNSERATEHRTMTEILEMLGRLQGNVDKLQSDLAELKSSQQQSVAICPPEFTYIPVINGCYKVVLDNLEWTVAQIRCRLLHKDAHLMFINSAVEQNQIASMLSNFSASELRSCAILQDKGKGFWTGGQRIDPLRTVDPSRPSTFVWKANPAGCDNDNTVEMTYTNWRQDEPNGAATQESCIHVLSGRQYMWNDIPCWWRYCAVCELDLQV